MIFSTKLRFPVAFFFLLSPSDLSQTRCSFFTIDQLISVLRDVLSVESSAQGPSERSWALPGDCRDTPWIRRPKAHPQHRDLPDADDQQVQQASTRGSRSLRRGHGEESRGFEDEQKRIPRRCQDCFFRGFVVISMWVIFPFRFVKGCAPNLVLFGGSPSVRLCGGLYSAATCWYDPPLRKVSSLAKGKWGVIVHLLKWCMVGVMDFPAVPQLW